MLPVEGVGVDVNVNMNVIMRVGRYSGDGRYSVGGCGDGIDYNGESSVTISSDNDSKVERWPVVREATPVKIVNVYRDRR